MRALLRRDGVHKTLCKASAIAAALALSGTAPRADPVHKPKRSTPVHPSRTAPDVTATIVKDHAVPKDHATPTVQAPAGPPVDDRTIPPPFTLPSATRAQIRACGEAWRDMKIAGTTGDDDWRDFAMHCFTGKGSDAAAR